MAMNTQAMSHREAWDVIPWLVNERLSEAELSRMNAHLADCTECRAEVEQQRRLRGLIAGDTRSYSVPGGSLKKLVARLDAQPTGTAAENATVPNKVSTPVTRI